MEKDIITILLEDGTKKDMELVLMYNDEINNNNYILYKDKDETKECYAAKCKLSNDFFELDTNLTKEEIKKLELLLNSTLKGSN